MTEATERLPILVLGLMPRTGTNLLGRLLGLHNDCTPGATLYEDCLVRGLPQMQAYIESVAESWQPHWPSHDRLDDLRRHLGDGLVSFLRSDAKMPGKRPVFKTPFVIGLELVDRFMPQLELLIVVRQGPAVVESGMRSFDWDFETASRRWGNAVAAVLAVSQRREAQGQPPLTLVRYEDLVTNTKAVLQRVFGKLALDPAGFDFDKLADFPVYGSSEQKAAEKNVHWKPVAKSADFDPLARAAHWPASAYERFDHLTQGLSTELGYHLPHRYSGAGIAAARQGIHDAKQWLPWRLQNLLRYRP
ncbi:sulfotransferase [Pelagibius litoralis]|uniref:Sulfotransferase n=1 Tax=Pelagibius litoralis TaxID=374515 RepID=A0A967C4D2_9PROT|nr:sulfotransferase [Pelagibius litoralis]NIA68515.1 sulfotransferase [Pelagibius litoralis]